MAERQVGEQQGTGTKSSVRNHSGSCSQIASITSELVSLSSGSESARKRPEWVTGWKKTPVTAGCSIPKRTISPTSASLTPRSTAAASETLTPASAQRSRARSFSSVRSLPADRELGLLLGARRTGGRRAPRSRPAPARSAGPGRAGCRWCSASPAGCRGPWRRRSISRICGWIEGSPPESCTASGSPSARTKASSIDSTCSSESEKPCSWGPVPESAKQIGQSRLQAVFTSMIPRQVCWACSGQIPQSCGQPSRASVWRSSG